jgi:predicted DNA-binding transcriptional regulator AlpA
MPPRTNRPAPAGFMWIDDAAEALGVEKSTLYTWRHKRRGPASFKHAGRVMYRKTAIDDYLNGCEAADSRSNPELNPVLRAPRPVTRPTRRIAA